MNHMDVLHTCINPKCRQEQGVESADRGAR